MNLPLRVGDTWTDMTLGDSIKIVSYNTQLSVGDSIYDAFTIKRTSIGPNYSLAEEVIFNENVGILRMSIAEFSGFPGVNRTISLLSFKR